MHNPMRGVVTSEHHTDGGYPKHRGRDIGARDPDKNGRPVWAWGAGRPVYAAFSGRWKRIVRWSKPGNRADTWAPTRTGNGGLISNPDGEGQGYNHVLILPRWKEGDWIDKGELIGHLDLSGNMSAPHLHFECWARWSDPYSDFSPKILFDKYKVDTFTDPAPLPPTITVQSAVTTTKTTTAPAPEKDWFDMATEAELRKIIREEAGNAVWNHKLGLPRIGGTTTTGAIQASDYVNNREAYALAKEIAKELGMSEARILEAIQAAEKSIGAAVETKEAN